MKVLFAVWEIDPLFKVGGLGDIARSLPDVLLKKGIDVRIAIPYYKVLKLSKLKRMKVALGKVRYAGIDESYEIYTINHPTTNVPIYFFKNHTYIDAVKSADMFAFFNKALVSSVQNNLLSWKPDVIHCNDHHTGYIPLLVKHLDLPVKTIYTIHNLAHQGITNSVVIDKLGIDKKKFRLQEWEIKSRQLNAMLEGIVHADVVTTVSPTYAKEIMMERFGMGLDEVLRGREGKVFGILNGIDLNHNLKLHLENVWYPYLPEKAIGSEFAAHLKDWEECKIKNKAYLQKKLGLKVTDKLPLFAFIGRLDPEQKGMDILHRMFRRINIERLQFVLLGTGSQAWEERFQWLSTFYPDSVSCIFNFDSSLANQIYASADFLLVPSKFEPCGLIQMLGLFFGTIPIANKTGGLVDTIIDGKNGFFFHKYTSLAMEKTVKKAICIWNKDKKRYKEMVISALQSDFSWEKSANEYIAVYDKLVSGQI
ncbi:hypothetical protein COV53_00055 [Candidatus Gottesmanbacteria bacterium CG11_big_fil_rev_8_21_14_0_20_37_11]|uniref:Glycogen synthase n=3 Tax=Candidatus Gottesmaniibacteriota TaxID=1752720 RepID=A0A2M7RQF0_9BACT|nr:MAG: hypothetical protein AUJ73_03145 [Candidatus Gottesmanbacteria bacterium CG1_02_37_22]PIR08984.1 MAG: hypothetical protein COV53_00055 [Candidatus Gottesmanbacteria bacterium CG11_big_fil_rev_8_21_14_0_20_37_11]PIZ02305.1 MAG: hypothetical protein COY59_05485 [Candidatus Gottesmanbacteria bacterium CG_4_10_14_0_8_um_filter_37_24]